MVLFDHAFGAIALSWLIATTSARIAANHGAAYQHQHLAVAIGERQVEGQKFKNPNHAMHPAPANAHSILAYVTPSLGASPVAVTKESQIVTSFIPEFTICELPPIAEFPISPPPQSLSLTTPYRNYSVSIPTGTGSCTTILSPTITMVCAATLTALDRKYTVTNCNDDITFSTEYGYTLALPSASRSAGAFANSTATITAAPSIVTLTTFYLAPWQQLTAGTAPSEVDLKICRTFANGTTECIREYQVWETSLVTLTATSTTSINISTTIHGPSQLIVETFVANVTERLTTFSMSTTMAIEFQTEYTTTNSANRTVVSTAAPISTGPTIFETFTVRPASGVSSAIEGSVSGSPALLSSGFDNITSTTVVHVTSTIYVATSTVTLQLGLRQHLWLH